MTDPDFDPIDTPSESDALLVHVRGFLAPRRIPLGAPDALAPGERVIENALKQNVRDLAEHVDRAASIRSELAELDRIIAFRRQAVMELMAHLTAMSQVRTARASAAQAAAAGAAKPAEPAPPDQGAQS
jgi:hypothetical protein